MSINFYYEKEFILLKYTPETGDAKYIENNLKTTGKYVMKNLIYLYSNKDNYKFNSEGSELKIQVAKKETDSCYYKLDKQVFDVENDIYFHQSVKLKRKYFLTSTNANIIKKFDAVFSSDLYIGGEYIDKVGWISDSDFKGLIKQFPTRYEHKLYEESRISQVLEKYVQLNSNYVEKYQNYMRKKGPYFIPNTNFQEEMDSKYDVKQNEIFKYSYLLQGLNEMLNSKNPFTEADWEEKLDEFLLLIFPKYVAKLRQVTFSNQNKKGRRPDFILIDILGYCDVIEIKRPDTDLIRNSQYRNNYVLSNELSSTVVQIENYLYDMNSNQSKALKSIDKKLEESIYSSLKLKPRIKNPKGIIIAGDKSRYNDEQKHDFEIVRRQYRNITDIITYDELIEAFERQIKMYSESYLDDSK